MKTLSIIIVSYNVKYYVEQCIRSVYRSEGIDLGSLELFVVDNLSKDGTVHYLRRRFPAKRHPDIHIIANKRNVGFGRANNQAVRRAKGKYILFLNPDTMLTEHTLHDALEEAESKEGTGGIGVRMLHTDGRFAPESRRGVPSPWAAFCKMSGFNSLFPHSRWFGRYYMQNADKNLPAAVDIVSGAFMMVPAAALQQTGLFDEDFFMYGEDIDLSFRLLKNGYQNRYVPTPILHYKGESTHKNSFHYVHVFYEAMLIFFRKHYRHYSFVFSLPVKAAIVASAIVTLITQQCRLLRRFLYPRSFHKRHRILYLGHETDDVQRIADEYGIDIDCIDADATTLPQGHSAVTSKAAVTYEHVVYDTSCFSLTQVLDHFEQHNPQKNHIGTYWPEQGVLLNPNKVYTLGQ